ncbi:hypothetical protein M406DRAFT_354319 [Cryphonectria parasitica EP155]|uniref:Apple domain-containing protein n=1 Tax=Cryphonectria parasitica (strain ATCC 38755 / EP155) TaxID=660469 RepID=A0A9P5CTC4_CRYP1|nr:uncharacterized protein M406DRAFT_354319 [Cryphonectria parasitica EP155]KAF3770193.1 hypothetical protein M406DRAFT_354319 [Cryphonectria parasitica EP155]
MAADYHYHNGGNPFEPPGAKVRAARICGLRRKVFWVVLALVVFGLMVAIAVGLGLGLGEQNNKSSSASSNSTATATSSSTATTLPAATATATATGNTDIICPTANETLYTLATQTSKKFLVLCGRDYNSDNGATDLTSMNITTFEGCLNECGNLDGCIAVGWGNYYGTNTCWLKSGIGTPNQSSDWYAAVEDDSG